MDGHPVIAVRCRLHPGLGLADRRPFGPANPDRGGELGLAPGPVEEHDQPPGDQLGHVGAEVVLHQGQGQVDAGRHAGARPHGPVADVDRVGVDLDRAGTRTASWSARAQWVVTRRPSSSPASAASRAPEQTVATRRARSGSGSDPADQLGVAPGRVHPAAAGQQQGVEALAVGRRGGRHQGDAALTGHRTRVGGHHATRRSRRRCRGRRRPGRAPANTSNGPVTSRDWTPGKARMATVRRGHASMVDRLADGVNDMYPTNSATGPDRAPARTPTAPGPVRATPGRCLW